MLTETGKQHMLNVADLSILKNVDQVYSSCN